MECGGDGQVTQTEALNKGIETAVYRISRFTRIYHAIHVMHVKSMLLSIDVGTSGVRAALFDERGNEVPGAQVRSRRSAVVSNFAELDPDRLVEEVVNTIDQLLTYLVNAQIDLIALSAFWHSLLGSTARVDRPRHHY